MTASGLTATHAMPKEHAPPADPFDRFHRERRPEASSATPEYTVITRDTPLGGAIYPFLETTQRAWSVVTRALDRPVHYPADVTRGLSGPTLRWVNGPHVVDVFVEGLATNDFLTASGLSLSLDNGGYVLSKRLSRLMRPYVVCRQFPASEVSVQYLDDLDPAGQQVWDGAGIISRHLLERLAIPSGVTPTKRAALERHLRRCRRVEVTLMTAAGQDKGHAIVADDLPTDLVLPRATKPDVKLVDGTRFVGITFLHAQESMRLDIQSLINLHPFFAQPQLAEWLDTEGQVFTQAVQSGSVAAAMGRIDHLTGLEDLASWPLREYFASGGQPLWFADVVRNLMNQHLDQMRAATLTKLRLPVPGGRFYLMPCGMGQAAGQTIDVPPGQICLDRAAATAWVNDEDWHHLAGASTGIAGLLGGADNDDAIWVHGFTDVDGSRQVLCWRSPNQVGEYVLLRPTPDSTPLRWETPDGPVYDPPADSRHLPPRKDTRRQQYQPKIDPRTAGGLGEGQAYSADAMQSTVQRALANAGTLGLYCNILMIWQAMYDRLPERLPAELEAVIDGSVKTGVDLLGVRAWCFAAAHWLRESGTSVPSVLAPRVAGERSGPPVRLTENHWLDHLVAHIRRHMAAFEQARDALAQTAMPPAVVFDVAFDAAAGLIDAGAGLHSAYTRTLHARRRQTDTLTPADYDAARAQAEAYVERFPPDQRTAVVRGAIVSAYLRERPADSVLWLLGARTGQPRAPGIAQLTLQALREIGVLQELGHTTLGLLAYPGAVIQEATYQRSIGITAVWFNWLRRWQSAQGHAPAATMREVSPAQAAWAKARVAVLAQTTYRHFPLTIQTQAERRVALAADGQLFGVLSPDSAVIPDGDITLERSLAHDGNLRSVWSASGR